MFNKQKNNTPQTKQADPWSAPALSLESEPTARVAESAKSPVGFDKSKPASSAAALSQLPASEKPSIVSESIEIRGELISTGALHVEGKVAGKVVAKSVHISASGVVDGELQCESLNVKGVFSGTAICDELVIASSARVEGNISYRHISAGTGAVIRGDLVCLVVA